LDYYRRDLGDGILSTDQEALSQQQSTGKTVSFTSSLSVACVIFQWADQLIQQRDPEQYYGVVSTSDIPLLDNAFCAS
jgi:hypothetical protein